MKCKYKESCGYEFCLDDCCPEFEEVVETNADRIRAMSDEELAEKDEFWIIKKVNGLCTVGWKVEFPQMLPKENHINDAAFKDIIF